MKKLTKFKVWDLVEIRPNPDHKFRCFNGMIGEVIKVQVDLDGLERVTVKLPQLGNLNLLVEDVISVSTP
jgi:ATP-dependent exoDNAse (exonuclease V) alpha subunit